MANPNVPPLVFRMGAFSNPDRSYRDEPTGLECVTNPDTGATFQRGQSVTASIRRCVQRDGDGGFTVKTVAVAGIIERISPATTMVYLGHDGACIAVAFPDELS